MIPEILRLGPFPLNAFGLLMVCTFLVGWQRLQLSLSEAGEDPKLAEPMVFWAAVGGLVGARIDYLFSFPEGVREHPLALIFGGSGFVFYGGLLGGLLAVAILLRRNGKHFFQYSDLVAPCLALGYAVGRVGCHLSGDGDYGFATSLPWGFRYELGVVPTPPGIYVHPTPIYETFAALGITWVLLEFARRKVFSRDGQLFGLYLILSAIARFLVEFMRIEPIVAFSLTQAQIVSLVIGLIGAGLAWRGVEREMADIK